MECCNKSIPHEYRDIIGTNVLSFTMIVPFRCLRVWEELVINTENSVDYSTSSKKSQIKQMTLKETSDRTHPSHQI